MKKNGFDKNTKKEKSIKKKSKSSKKDSYSSKRKSIKIINDNSNIDIFKKSDTLVFLSKENELKNIDEKNFTESSYSTITNEFFKISNCSILKYGIKISTDKIYFAYCQTCDVNLIHPICLECARICHQQLGHKIKEMKEQGFIRCGCGEKLHRVNNFKRNSKLLAIKECPYSDLCEKSRLSTLYIINGKCVCEFCYRMCGYEGAGQPLEKEKEMLQVCECEDLNGIITHRDLKSIYKKFMDILSSKSNLIFGIEPVKFLNLLFLGKSSYDSLFFNFEEMIQNFYKLNPNNLLNLKDTFTSTNFYLSLKIFVKILEKANDSSLAYYSDKLVKKFSFKLISNLLDYVIFQDTSIFWNFLSEMLFLYKKINIEYNTIKTGEFKISDLENILPLQRKCIMLNNESIFPDATEQITFFIKSMNNLLKNEVRSIEAYNFFINICEILERFSRCYLMNIANMTMFCFTFEEMFQYFKNQNTYEKQIELYYIIIKMLFYFIYCYNDNNIYNYLFENKNKKLKKVEFAFFNNQLGNLITRHTIRIMYFTLTISKYNQLNIDIQQKCSNILNIGTKIFSLLIETDSYFINSSINDNLLILLLIPDKDIKLNRLKDEINIIENEYLKYYNFELDKRDLINEVFNSLERLISKGANDEIRFAMLKTNYINILCKIFYIVNEKEEIMEQEDLKLYNKIILNILNFLFYFIQENEDNATLVCSDYIMNALIKLPDTYALIIFKLYSKCINLIHKNSGFFINPIPVTETLYKYLINYKKNSKKIWNKRAEDFFVDDAKIIDQIIFFFLSILIKISLESKLLNPYSCEKYIKNILLSFMKNFEYSSLINYNACLLLVLINKIFDSSEKTERDIILKLIPINKLKDYIEDSNTLLNLRTQILIFISKFTASLYFKKDENCKKYYKNIEILSINNNSNKNNGTSSENKGKNNEKKKKVIHPKLRNRISIINSNILKVNIDYLFRSNDEEPLKNNIYLNAIGQDQDIFLFLKENALITNYQYPSKYFTFNYYLKKVQENDFETLDEIINLFEEELKKFKFIKEKITDINKLLKYYVKGIIFPFCSIINNAFCNAGEYNGKQIIRIYQAIIKMVFVKITIIENNNYLNERRKIKFQNFDIKGFLYNSNDDTLNDFYILKEKQISPYDFTFLYKMLYKHFIQYIKYPSSLNLENNFPLGELGYLKYGNISEEMDILEEIYLNIQKKIGNSLIINNISKENQNLLLINDNKINQNQETINFYGSKIQKDNFEDNKNKFDKYSKQMNNLKNKIKKVFDFYYNEKRKLTINNFSLLNSLSALCSEYEVNYRKLLLCLIVNLPNDLNEYDLLYKIIFFKLLFISPMDTQSDIIDLMAKKDTENPGFLVNYCNSLYCNIIKYFIDDFNLDFDRYKIIHINIFCLSKILKQLCELHNNYFQGKLTGSINFYFSKLEECKMNISMKSGFFSSKIMESLINSNSSIMSDDFMSFFNFLLNSLHKFLIITDQARNVEHIGFIYDLFYSIIELAKEMIQGNKKELLYKIKNEPFKIKYNDMSLFTFKTFVSLGKDILFNDSLISGPSFNTRLLIISFFIILLEEKTNKELQKIIMKFLIINNVLDSIILTLKNYFIEQAKDDIKYKNYFRNYSEKQIIQREIIFNHEVYYFFKSNYFKTDLLKSSQEFKLANNYYIYIKKISINGKSAEAKDLIKKVGVLSEYEAKKKFAAFNNRIIKSTDIAPINLINEKERTISISYIEHYYIIKFFELITKVVEIRLPHERRNVNVIFTVPSSINYLTNMTKKEFIYNVDRTNENSKKFELVRGIPLFQLEIEYFKNMKVNFISRIILKIDYLYIQILMYLYATAFLLIMLFTLKGYTKIEPVIESSSTLRELSSISTTARKLIEIPSYITSSIDESIEKYGLMYDIINYVFVALNGAFIISWIAVKLPLYYIFDKFKYMEQKKITREEDLTFLRRMHISILYTILRRDYINSLIYMFIISLIGAIMKRGEIIYAFILLAILDLNTTLKGILLSIKERGSDLLAAFLLLVFIVYFYSVFGFFFFNDHFEADIEDDIKDNYCSTLFFCFLTNFDAGIRARGGAADQMIRISFQRNTAAYVYRLFYDISYFLICIIIMIDLTVGIVLGTFSKKREEETKHDNDKINHCFICDITREIIEKKRENFNVHREQKHNIWNYMEYMIYLKFSDFHELSTFNSFAKTNLEKKNICFLPSCQDDFDEEEIVEENKTEEGNKIGDINKNDK